MAWMPRLRLQSRDNGMVRAHHQANQGSLQVSPPPSTINAAQIDLQLMYGIVCTCMLGAWKSSPLAVGFPSSKKNPIQPAEASESV